MADAARSGLLDANSHMEVVPEALGIGAATAQNRW